MNHADGGTFRLKKGAAYVTDYKETSPNTATCSFSYYDYQASLFSCYSCTCAARRKLGYPKGMYAVRVIYNGASSEEIPVDLKEEANE